MKGVKGVYWIAGLLVLLAVSCAALYLRMRTTENQDTGMKLVLYEGPVSLPDATEEDMGFASESQRDISLMHCTDTQITVDGQDCYVYDTLVNHSRNWNSGYQPALSRTPITYFDFEVRADIVLTVPERELDSVVVRPSSYGIEPVIDREKHTVSFSVYEPDTYTVEFDGSPERAVHIFANPLETELPDFEDENVIYIGPGEWDIENISLESGQTLYLAGGAVVHGAINSSFTTGVTVMGRGIIDGSCFDGWMGQTAFIPLKFDNCKEVTVKGIISLNANAWVCQLYATKGAVVDGLKIISARPNGDGISIQSCQGVEVKNSFVRTWDDSLVVKNYRSSSQNIHFDNIQIWTDLAQSMEIGYETNKGEMENSSISDVSFSNICVLHNFHKPVISIHNADDADVHDITYKNIVVEDCRVGSGDASEMPYLIDIWICDNGNWSTTPERGTIHDVLIENVQVLGGRESSSRIKGYDASHMVSDITIRNLEILGKKIDSLEAGQFKVNEKTVSNVHVISDNE